MYNKMFSTIENPSRFIFLYSGEEKKENENSITDPRAACEGNAIHIHHNEVKSDLLICSLKEC